MEVFGGWEVIKPLGKGGQGTVYLVRTPTRAQERARDLDEIDESLRPFVHGFSGETIKTGASRLAAAIFNHAQTDTPADLAALKRIHLGDKGAETEKAIERFKLEVETLRQVNHPGILNLLDANLDEHWMVSEYHPNRTLADHPVRYKGQVRIALEAFRSLLDGVAKLNEKGIVHRDIKPQNIFIAADERLVLGDFGIVFYQDENREHLTTTFEKVGPRDWIPIWAHTGRRLEDVKPSFDVFMLGKVLWAMISGEKSLPREYWDKDGYNLEKLFPGEPDMSLVNLILSRCIVEEEKNCIQSAGLLLIQVDAALKMLRRGGQLLGEGVIRPCGICGQGNYDRVSLPVGYLSKPVVNLNMGGTPIIARLFACSHCGHIQLFKDIS